MSDLFRVTRTATVQKRGGREIERGRERDRAREGESSREGGREIEGLFVRTKSFYPQAIKRTVLVKTVRPGNLFATDNPLQIINFATD